MISDTTGKLIGLALVVFIGAAFIGCTDGAKERHKAELVRQQARRNVVYSMKRTSDMQCTIPWDGENRTTVTCPWEK